MLMLLKPPGGRVWAMPLNGLARCIVLGLLQPLASRLVCPPAGLGARHARACINRVNKGWRGHIVALPHV